MDFKLIQYFLKCFLYDVKVSIVKRFTSTFSIVQVLKVHLNWRYAKLVGGKGTCAMFVYTCLIASVPLAAVGFSGAGLFGGRKHSIHSCHLQKVNASLSKYEHDMN